MIEISDNIFIEGFGDKKEFDKWLEEQENIEPNENILKMFKYSLMKLEKDAKENIYNEKHINLLEKYSKKVIERRLMKEKDVIKFIGQAQEK